MIVFLTLVYVGVLLLLWKLGVIRMTLAWKLSPLLCLLLLNVLLFIPMQWGAPAGPVAVFRNVIEIVPAVAGQVVDVPIQPLAAIKQGDVLFQIDPKPFQDEVNRLSAALTAAQQQPELLKASVEIAEAALARTQAQQEQAQAAYDRSANLVKTGAVSQEKYEEDQRTSLISDRAVKEAEASLRQARLQLESVTEEGENTTIAQARHQLERAKFDLEHATVRAPSDGVVQQLALRPGARVVAMPLRAALVFVDRSRTRLSVAIRQNQLRHVREGQAAEVTFKLRPGRTYAAKVVGVSVTTSGGQVQSSGIVEDLLPHEQRAEPYQVVLELADDRIVESDLRGGAVGMAAIYTDRVRFTHVIRKVMVRMQSWINYLW